MDQHSTNASHATRDPQAAAVSQSEALRRRLLLIVTLFLALGLVAALTVTASGQRVQYDSIPLHPAFEDPKNMRIMDTAAKEVARARDPSTVQNARFAQVYYSRYLPAKITQKDALKDISPLTQSAMKSLANAQRAGAPGATRIVEWLFAGMKGVAEGNYHPAARINALMILGRLDARPADSTARRPPVPYPQSFPILMAQYQKEANPDGVRAVALQGIRRFVSFASPSLKPQDKANLQKEMQSLLDAEAPEGRDRLAHAYMQRYAVDILSALQPPKGGTLGQQLVSISTEKDRPDLIALYSVSRLGRLGKDLEAKVDNVETVMGHWTVRAMRAFQYEAARLKLVDGIPAVSNQPPSPRNVVTKKEEEKPVIPTYGGDEEYEEEEMEEEYDSGMEEEEYYEEEEMDDDFGMYVTAEPQPPEIIASRRRLNHVLQQIQRGVTGDGETGVPSQPGGLMAVSADDAKSKLESWVEDMEEVVTALNDPMLDDRNKYIDALEVQVAMLQSMAGAVGQEAAAEDAKVPLGLNPYANLARLSDVEVLRGQPEVAPIEIPPAPEGPDAADGPPAPSAAVPAAADPAAVGATKPPSMPTGS